MKKFLGGPDLFSTGDTLIPRSTPSALSAPRFSLLRRLAFPFLFI